MSLATRAYETAVRLYDLDPHCMVRPTREQFAHLDEDAPTLRSDHPPVADERDPIELAEQVRLTAALMNDRSGR